jgi:hypothetical protein
MSLNCLLWFAAVFGGAVTAALTAALIIIEVYLKL